MPSVCRLSCRWLQWLELGQSEAKNHEAATFSWFAMWVMGPHTGTVLCCSARHIGREQLGHRPEPHPPPEVPVLRAGASHAVPRPWPLTA